jgi:hypothetical protein
MVEGREFLAVKFVLTPRGKSPTYPIAPATAAP